jgi:hypothetical protein
MTQRRRSAGVVFFSSLLALLLAGAATAAAHVTEESGPFEVEMGWAKEPPSVDGENFVEVGVSEAGGKPVPVPAGALSVEVAYADTAVTLPLVPTEEPGGLEAALTPTRPGTYAFHVSGTVHGQSLDVGATCSQSTFECVDAVAGNEFPVKDPSIGEMTRRLDRESDRVEEANDSAEGARTLAIVALALAAVALALSIRTARRRRGSGRP